MRLKTLMTCSTLLCCFSMTAKARDIKIGGPDVSLTPGSFSWSWDGGSQVAPFREALNARFGPLAAVPSSIETRDLAVINALTLGELDVFVSCWWADADTPANAVDKIIEYFLNGGGLILFQDDSAHDKIGETLGLPTLSSDGSPSNADSPLFDGPFGTASNVLQGGGATGRIDATQVFAHGGKIGALNAAFEVTAAYWEPGDYAVGAGPLLIIADVDMMSNVNADYATMNDNARFSLNGVSTVLPDYVLGGPDSMWQSSASWSWEGGTFLEDYRQAIDSSSFFGSGGILRREVSTRNLLTIGPTTLETLDGFVVPWWADAEIPSTIADDIIDFFLAGGDLILYQDDPEHDKIGELLGLPVAGSADGSASNGDYPIIAGPFGDAVNVEHFLGVGFLDANDVLDYDGQVGATNNAGEITAAYWKPGQYAPTSGSLVIVTDIDMIANTKASYSPLNANGMAALNQLAFLINDYVIAGPSLADSPSSGPWAWDGGAQIQEFRGAIEDGFNFGPHGKARIGVHTRVLSAVTAESLSKVDAFASTYWADTETSDQSVSQLVDFFLAGGDLILFQDDPWHDKIGDALGIPTTTGSNLPSSGGAPLFDGSFGNSGLIEHAGLVGQLSLSDISTHNGTVVGLNGAGEITAALWNDGDYARVRVKLVIITDTDTIAVAEANFDTLDANARFGLNTVEFLSCTGFARLYGAGCAGSGGFIPFLDATGCPSAGDTVSVRLRRGLGGAQTLIFLGLNGRGSIPVGPCTFLVAPSFVNVSLSLPGVGPGVGQFTLMGEIPQGEWIAGQSINMQAVIFDPGAASGIGLAFSNGLEFLLGH